MNPHWVIESVRHAGPYYSVDTGAPRAAECFKAELRRGEESVVADVELTLLPGQEIEFQPGRFVDSTPSSLELAEGDHFIHNRMKKGFKSRERSARITGSKVTEQ